MLTIKQNMIGKNACRFATSNCSTGEALSIRQEVVGRESAGTSLGASEVIKTRWIITKKQ